MENIIIYKEYQKNIKGDIISLDQYYKKELRRKKRLARRIYKRFPLFATEFVSEKYADFSINDLDYYLEGMKPPKKKKGKSQIKRMGRYPLYVKALNEYQSTKDINKLYEAQRIRNNMFKPYRILYNTGEGKIEQKLPAELNYKIVIKLSKLKFENEKDLCNQIDDILKYTCF